uniref:Alkyl transferase n=1 Tax=Globodera pallida TaxID=36090 RepID=A0A183BQL3_GLOPA
MSIPDGPTWFRHEPLSWWGRFLVSAVKLGPTPRHIAIVMDGNRRFARYRKLGTVMEGHSAGFVQLTKVLDWCDTLGVEEVTVFAFSIENFKRSEDEVNGLMTLGEKRFTQLLEHTSKLIERRVGIRFFGDRSLLSDKIRELMAEIERINPADGTNTKIFLNICLSYTSQNELLRAFEAIRRDVKAGTLDKNKIDAALLSARMDTRDCRPLDLLIRTSECRLSDFLIWQLQCSPRCIVKFDSDVLWPQYSLFHLLRAIVHYQMAQLRCGWWTIRGLR